MNGITKEQLKGVGFTSRIDGLFVKRIHVLIYIEYDPRIRHLSLVEKSDRNFKTHRIVIPKVISSLEHLLTICNAIS